ncbi:MAG: RNA polymerase sigma factor [Flavobacteriales bacterium]|nr:RNA polymerase sigma factor [Flavobacteriales bacterium]MDG1765457.1 RNA polymerase sigma factor [Flavobacteriales bacterium]
MTDQELVQACLKGNGQAQKELFDRYAGRMMAVCVRYAMCYEDAQDILQEGFIKVFEKLKQYSGKGALGAWIRMIMVNTALIHLRKHKKLLLNDELSDGAEFEHQTYTVLENMAADEILELVQALPAGYRTVFNLYAIEGYAHKEIAEMLDITESTSKTQYFKAKAQLKRALNSREESEFRR